MPIKTESRFESLSTPAVLRDRKLPKKYFSKFKKSLADLPNLVEAQTRSFEWLVKSGLKEVFEEFAAIKDYSEKKFEFEFLDFKLSPPKHDEFYAKDSKLSYEASLKVGVRLKNKVLGTVKEQEIFLADFPLMTNHGTFIISGVERVIVPQLARSFGVFFTSQEVKGRRYFGAKIIPARGVWIEIEADPDGAVYVRIDRKRKFPVTSLMRVLGAGSNEEIMGRFESDAETRKIIEATLSKDHARAADEAFLEIHKRLRDGEIGTVENAREFVSGFLSEERYDLSKVGRFRFNKRFKKSMEPAALERRTVDLDDLSTVLSHIASLASSSDAMEDDIDHLGSRRVRYVGELLQSKIRVGMTQIKRNIQDRMSTISSDVTVPVQFISPKPLQARIKEFFTTNQLSQFMQQENILQEIEHLRTLSALGPGGLTRERAGFEVRDVHPSHYGRLCPIHTPEGPNIGLILRLATFARINEFGMIETPYAKVKDGSVTGEIHYLNALEEESHNIAHAATGVDEGGRILEEEVEVRIGGEPGLVGRSKVDYIDVGMTQAFSIATSMIPFLNHDDANRALMGSNMQKQAVPCVVPEAPLVATGIEEKAACDSGRLLYSKEEGTVAAADCQKVVVKGARGKETEYRLINFSRTNGFTAFHQRPAVSVGDKVKKGALLADTSSSSGGTTALGQNVLVAFMSWAGSNYEDAIVISERLVKENKFTSIHIEEFMVNVRDTKLGPELTTPDIPNVGEVKLRNLDEDGVVRVGAEVRPGDILVGKITPKGESQLTPEERLLRSLFGEKARDVKDTSKRMEGGKRGRVITVKVFSRERGDKLESGIIKKIFIEVAELRPVTVGDKLAGRHGNKGVISKVLAVEDMPYMDDGTPVDIILTPLGVPSRMNLGQILELHLGLAAHTLGYQAVVPPFAGATDEEIKKELEKAGFAASGKMPLYDGRTGERFEQNIAVGFMYILKLHHMVVDKIHMRSIGPYSLITQQPLGGKAQGGGQRFGEMEVWALLGHGAAHTLREMLTIKSDDIAGRSAAFDAIVKGEPISQTNIPASFNVLLHNLRGLCLDVELKRETGALVAVSGDRLKRTAAPEDFEIMTLKLASPERIKEWSYGEVTKPETINYRTQRSEKNGLFDEKIFGPDKDFECYCGKYRGVRYKGIICEKCGVEITRSIVRRERMGHIELASPVSHIWLLRSLPSRMGLLLGIPAADLEKVIYFAGYIVTKVNLEERGRLLKELDKEYKTKFKNLNEEATKEAMRQAYAAAKTELEGLREGQVLDEVAFHSFSLKYGAAFEAGIGAEAIYEIFKSINLKKLFEGLRQKLEKAGAADRDKIHKRMSLAKSMIKAGLRPEWMFVTRIPVIPAALRPMVPLDGGRYATSDVNDLYRRVINRNNRLKKLIDINAPDVILRNEKRILQEAVDSLIDNSIRRGGGVAGAFSTAQRRPLKSLSDNLKGKRGLFRQNLLGKRVDYSGRSVIVIGPELKINQCGLPKHMALELFRPFVIGKLLERELAFNIRGAGRLIDEDVPEVWAILEEVIADKYVLLNRAPTLHRLGIQAFKPILIEGNAIQIHPLVCAAFNADFDGDQMAVHLPLSDESQAEAREIMAADKNILKPGSGDPVISAKMLDIVLGCYWMTKIIPGSKGDGKAFPSPNAAITAFDLEQVGFRAKILVLGTDSPKYREFSAKIFETSVGRLLFNSVLPKDYPYINEEVERKKMLAIVDDLISRYGLSNIPEIMDKIKALGFRYATYSGITWGLDDVSLPVKKAGIIAAAKGKSDQVNKQYDTGLLSKEERIRKNIEVWHGAKNEVERLIPESLDQNGSVYDMVYSGARGSLSQITQMAGMKGLIQNTAGETIEFPVLSSMKEGLTPIEYFITTHGSRKGLTDTALNTAKAGYLTRRLFDVAQDTIITEEDCGTKETVTIRRESASGMDVSLARNLRGRVLGEDAVGKDGRILFKKGTLLSKKEAKLLEDEGFSEAAIRSPLTCKSIQGICAVCYGADLGRGSLVGLGEAVGTIAAQAIGEPGTQLTMRTFHSGGTAQVGGDITQGLPRVEEVFEKRLPKNPAVIAQVDGTVAEIKDLGQEKVIVIIPEVTEKRKKKEMVEYTVNFRRMILVKEGQAVKRGDILTDGSADIEEIFEYGGKEMAENYIISEVSKLYELQGESVARKHIEVIVRRMFSRRLVLDEGDTNLSRGDIVGLFELREENAEVRRQGGKEAKAEPVVLGITEVSLLRKSFLSAASFQHTTRVLINAAVRGNTDRLVGLKENVIIGRLIPAGTGFAGSPKAEIVERAGGERREEVSFSQAERRETAAL